MIRIKKGMIFYASILWLLILIAYADSTFAQEEPWYIKEWKAFSRQSNDPVLMNYAKLISTPESLRLGREWKKLLGYTAPDLVKKDDPAISPVRSPFFAAYGESEKPGQESQSQK